MRLMFREGKLREATSYLLHIWQLIMYASNVVFVHEGGTSGDNISVQLEPRWVHGDAVCVAQDIPGTLRPLTIYSTSPLHRVWLGHVMIVEYFTDIFCFVCTSYLSVLETVHGVKWWYILQKCFQTRD